MKNLVIAACVSCVIVFVVFFATTVMIYNCHDCGKTEEYTVAKEAFFNYTLDFCDKEDCLQKITAQLIRAKDSISCAFYGVDDTILGNLSEITNMTNLTSATIIVDKKTKIADKYTTNGLVLKYESKGIMHNKYCIIDNATVITGSFNPTAAAKGDYNDLLAINSTSLATFYSNNFESLKESLKNSFKQVKVAVLNDTIAEVYFCPEDDCTAAVKAKLAQANHSIVFAVYSFTHPEIANELIVKSSEGVSVVGVMEQSTTGSEYSKHAVMAANGIGIKLETSKRLLHYKFFVIDNETVITGSFNPTKNADERNNENIIIIRNKTLAGKYLEEFGKIRAD